MMVQKVRKVGNSYVVTIPREVVESQRLQEGDTVAIEVRKVDYRVQMDPDVRAAFERSLELYPEDYDYLGEN
ncbi:MAG TPA: AbrB/MazE/SpoVT family DNA-binding domain-containing protein [Chloroflexia bacterium]|nr:AbrB/MazE/SpoVT family DNA-binding domain-containing protein [Chloroflexia bacterium]